MYESAGTCLPYPARKTLMLLGVAAAAAADAAVAADADAADAKML